MPANAGTDGSPPLFLAISSPLRPGLPSPGRFRRPPPTTGKLPLETALAPDRDLDGSLPASVARRSAATAAAAASTFLAPRAARRGSCCRRLAGVAGCPNIPRPVAWGLEGIGPHRHS